MRAIDILFGLVVILWAARLFQTITQRWRFQSLVSALRWALEQSLTTSLIIGFYLITDTAASYGVWSAISEWGTFVAVFPFILAIGFSLAALLLHYRAD